MKPKIVALILAAGCSRRMGERNKLLESVKGKTMVRWVAEAALQSQVQATFVVTGFEADKVMACLSGLSVSEVFNFEYEKGMASSLICGIKSLGDVDGVVVMLGDMPFVGADHLNALLGGFDGRRSDNIVVPVNAGRRGNPVLWSKVYFSQMMDVEGDVGARGLLARYGAKVTEVVVESDAIFFDVDTVECLSGLNG
ncbi:MAG: nucleotidyltransferase family protein [Spongiibacteraceae bacterium]|nr:nucleotidyltransferase family protein [Spongiibacteraceae bacterium]